LKKVNNPTLNVKNIFLQGHIWSSTGRCSYWPGWISKNGTENLPEKLASLCRISMMNTMVWTAGPGP
jgi:hypothetical protein